MLKWKFPPNSSATNRGQNMNMSGANASPTGRSHQKTNLLIKAGMLAIAAAIVCGPSVQAQKGAPRYEADLTWPKPLPDRWVLGGLGGVCVDAQDHVFILNRQDVLEGDLNAGRVNLFVYLFERGEFASRVRQVRSRMLARGDQLLTSALTLGELLV